MTLSQFGITVTNEAALAVEVVKMQRHRRLLVAIFGSPGSGKSTLADRLRAEISQSFRVSAEVVPMDGFHYDNAILDDKGLRPRKGSPETFDVDGLASLLQRLRARPPRDVAIPVFDRTLDMTRASAQIIGKDVEIVLVEGNYLLLDQEPWDRLKDYFDVTVKIECPREELEKRLMQRWLDLGMSEEKSRSKVEGNDLLNADLIESTSLAADINFVWQKNSNASG